MAVVALTLGILTVLLGISGTAFELFGMGLAVVGVLLGQLGIQKEPGLAGISKLGRNLSVIGLILCIIFFVVRVFVFDGVLINNPLTNGSLG